MNKLLIGILASLAVISSLVAGLIYTKYSPTEVVLGKATAYPEQASSTASYFGLVGGGSTGNKARTATGTLLTLEQIDSVSKIALQIDTTATSSSADCSPSCGGITYILPMISQDAITWTELGNLSLANVPQGTALADINLGAASSTFIKVIASQIGITSKQFIFTNVVAKYMRFQAWSSGTSTVLLKARQVREY